MKATRASLAFAAATVAALLAPATTQAGEFHNARFEGTQSLPQVHPGVEERWQGMSEHSRSMKPLEITAKVTFNQKGRATNVVLQGTTGSESKDYTIRRMLLRTRFDLRPEEIGQPVTVVVQYHRTA